MTEKEKTRRTINAEFDAFRLFPWQFLKEDPLWSLSKPGLSASFSGSVLYISARFTASKIFWALTGFAGV